MFIRTAKPGSSAMFWGGFLGLMFGGLYGLILGAGLGYMLSNFLGGVAGNLHPQQILFRATFTVLGKISKADGQVSQDEISCVSNLMDQMSLSEAKRQEAIKYFNAGKSPEVNLAEALRPLAVFLKHQPNILQFFVEVQLQVALADGEISQSELDVIYEACGYLNMSRAEVNRLLERVQGQQSFHQAAGPQALKAAYQLLEVSETASDAEVKKAYRRLMSQYHPDKLVAKGLPEEMMQVAKEKAQEIQSAYENIKKSRK